MTRHALTLAAAATLAVGGTALAQSQQQQSQSAEQRDTEMVSIKRSATYGLSNEVPRYLSDAYEDMYKAPEEATEDMMIASNFLEMLAAASEGEGRTALKEAADEISRTRQKVQNRQLLNPEDLSKPFAQASLAIAVAQHAEAEAGLGRGDESAVAYSLNSAADNLQQSLIYMKKNPSDDVAKAIYNADRLGGQLKKLVEPTTQQGSQFAVSIPEEKSDAEDVGILDGAQTASAQQGGQNGQSGGKMNVAQQIPTIAPEVVAQLGSAIESVRGQMK